MRYRVRDVPEAPVPPQPVRRGATRFIDLESECRSLDQLLALLVIEGRASAAPRLRQAERTFAGADVAVEERLQWGWLAHVAAAELWDEDLWHAITVRQTRVARDVGALEQLALDLNS